MGVTITTSLSISATAESQVTPDFTLKQIAKKTVDAIMLDISSGKLPLDDLDSMRVTTFVDSYKDALLKKLNDYGCDINPHPIVTVRGAKTAVYNFLNGIHHKPSSEVQDTLRALNKIAIEFDKDHSRNITYCQTVEVKINKSVAKQLPPGTAMAIITGPKNTIKHLVAISSHLPGTNVSVASSRLKPPMN